ncbi:hypothetical protein IE53DRAFT_343282 [Violaceomyces palustris]|uniref:Uncharacterized protein n=1 Tax=Violaceomyces palustris TaxID=1673888 RepID=A0ACD0NYK4_9BASI|nr:hypothetical protein IE53DRAFT_343282 [Violaceomyces palustris]
MTQSWSSISPDGNKTSILWENRKCLLICSLVSLGVFSQIFESKIMAGFQIQPDFLKIYGYQDKRGRWQIPTNVQQLTTSFTTLGQMIGAISLGFLSNFKGRVDMMKIAYLIAFSSLLARILTTSVGILYLTCVGFGWSTGYTFATLVLYVGECSVSHLRGVMLSIHVPMIGIAAILGKVVSKAYSNGTSISNYHTQLGLAMILPGLLFILVHFIPETPRWLAARGRLEDATKSLQSLRGSQASPSLIEEEIRGIRDSTAEEEKMRKSARCMEMFQGTNLRRTLLVFGVVLMHTSTGDFYMIAFSSYAFKQAGRKDPFTDSIIYSLLGFFGGCASLAVVKIFRRRVVLLASLSISFLIYFVTAAVFSFNDVSEGVKGRVLVAFYCLYSFFHQMGAGPMLMIVASEIPSNKLRTATFGLCWAIGSLIQWATAFTAPYFLNPEHLNWGPRYNYFWAAGTLLSILWCYFFLPETKDRELEVIDAMFRLRLKVDEFPLYQPTESGQAVGFGRSAREAVNYPMKTFALGDRHKDKTFDTFHKVYPSFTLEDGDKLSSFPEAPSSWPHKIRRRSIAQVFDHHGRAQ